jgi:arabinosaccharide transport system substrate-binding protein
MEFHLGKPILILSIVAVLSGGLILSRLAPPQADLQLWTFTAAHADTYRAMIPDFERQHGLTVSIESLSSRAEGVRLESMFMSGQTRRPLPDLVEIEIGQIARFFRPPVDAIGLEPLNAYLERDGWTGRLLESRLATWSKDGVIFGIPHDVHPVSITYRDDLFRAAGIDLSQAQTWTQFQEMCLAFQDYWQQRGLPTRHAIELPRASADYLTVMLLQRGVNLIDADESIHIADPIVARTIAFYAQLVAGQRRIGGETAGGNEGLWSNDVVEGNLCAFMTPDWRVYPLKLYAPSLSGSLRMMPLPRFEPSDAPTGTWGGTMIGITRGSQNKAAAWELLKHLYLSDEGLAQRQRVTDVLPAVKAWWDSPSYHAGDPYFGGQKIEELYINLARQLPARHVTPMTPIAQAHLSYVVGRAADYVDRQGTEGLEAQIQQWLAFAARDLAARIQHGRFDG